MAIDDKKVKEFEDNYREKLFNSFRTISLNQSKVFAATEKIRRENNLITDLPNIGITLNNKLVQLQHEFENVGISIYLEKTENCKEIKLNYIGEAVLLDLIRYARNGIESSNEYQEKIDLIVTKKLKKIHGREDDSAITKVFTKMKRTLVPLKQKDLLFTQKEIQTINQTLSSYKDVDNQLWNYNLRSNVVSSITKKIREQKCSANEVPKLLEESVIPDLQKLGLADLIPELQRTLVEEYKKDLPASEIYQISKKDMHLYVPDFNRETKHTEKTTEELHKQEQMIIEQEETTQTMNASLKQEGITLEDFSVIDSEVSALDRQKMINMISNEQKTEKNEGENLVLKEDKKLGEEGGNISL